MLVARPDEQVAFRQDGGATDAETGSALEAARSISYCCRPPWLGHTP